MKHIRILFGAMILSSFSSLANAYLVTDVITFDRFFDAGDSVSWTHDMTRHGYVPKGVYDLPDFTLTLNWRDADDYPGKEDIDRPFYMLSQDQGRIFGRVRMEDFVINPSDTPVFVAGNGIASPRVTIIEGRVWFGSAILTMEITPVPVPAPFSLLGLGLLALALRLRVKNQ